MRLGPFGPGLRPRERPALFALDPFILPDLFLDQVGHAVEGVSVHHRRDRHVLLDFQNLAHWITLRRSFDGNEPKMIFSRAPSYTLLQLDFSRGWKWYISVLFRIVY